jgi:hypothetical protein
MGLGEYGGKIVHQLSDSNQGQNLKSKEKMFAQPFLFFILKTLSFFVKATGE